MCVYDCRDKKLLKKYKHPPQAGEECTLLFCVCCVQLTFRLTVGVLFPSAAFYSLAWTMLPHRSRRGDFSMPVIAAGGT